MKKFILLVAVTMTLGFASCANKTTEATEEKDTVTVVEDTVVATDQPQVEVDSAENAENTTTPETQN